ncbi:hypothetical protein CI105_07175 [Candidatus Izimaplasma bacterium ZiA1]|uniref:hypothetical protein n=1 Tax=Candidatus Izimoplasma sp. ZiA1 TaxID=2024899 RepID=UPI000BAA6C26|nr:hypothetical protein CI105_07175 [Candidatus Izimaplasma bacterium ZiA1]
MNKYINSEANQHVMKLIQLGAAVQVVSGKMVYASFKFEQDVEVSYAYNINKNNKYFLERIKPYPLSIKEFENPEDVIELIKIDYDQFTNAVKSHNIKNFIKINNSLNKSIKAFEDLFLYYNIPAEYTQKIEHNIEKIQETIQKASKECNRVFFTKEPENL